jgi:predicted amidohydrolase YtcJ
MTSRRTPSGQADLVIRNADVRTMDPAHPRAEAVAIAGGRIVGVGDTLEVIELAGRGAEHIDARGATVTPGIIDSHNHVRLGANPHAVSLFGAESLTEIRHRIAVHLDRHPELTWVEGEGWNYTALPGGVPSASLIDEVCRGRPAWLFSYDVHTVWLNSEALRRWGASGPDAEVPFGRLERDAVTGQPTGWVHDFAVRGIHPRGQAALTGMVPGYTLEAQFTRLAHNLDDAARFGITTIVEPQNGLSDLPLFRRAHDEGRLRAGLVAAIMHTPEDPRTALEDVARARREAGGAPYRLGPVKLYMDDVIEPHTAAMLSPYADRPGCQGETYWSAEEFGEVVRDLERLGLQAFVHATGDRGIRTALDGFARARRAHGERDTRHQIVHVECLHPDDLGRFAELGVVACMQPRHCAPDLVGEWRENVGPERERYAWPMRSLADAGAPLAFSSDWNVAEMDPLVGIQTALTRADLSGRDGWNLAETVDLDTALAAYTRGGAWANFLEGERGMLARGMAADLVVWSENLHSLPAQEITGSHATHTIVDGLVVHRAG